MARLVLVMIVILSSTYASGSHVNKGDELSEGSPSKKVLLSVQFTDLQRFISAIVVLLCRKTISILENFRLKLKYLQGRGCHCSHQRGWWRIQREHRGGPKQANRIVSSSRSSWSGSQWHLTWFQTSKLSDFDFNFSLNTAYPTPGFLLRKALM